MSPLVFFLVRSPESGEWIKATRDGMPVVMTEKDFATFDFPREKWNGLGRALLLDLARGEYVPLNPDDLDGATDEGRPLSYPATPGEFAARWNKWTPERRESGLREAIRCAEIASRSA